jgi:hypothetical protein
MQSGPQIKASGPEALQAVQKALRNCSKLGRFALWHTTCLKTGGLSPETQRDKQGAALWRRILRALNTAARLTPGIQHGVDLENQGLTHDETSARSVGLFELTLQQRQDYVVLGLGVLVPVKSRK